MNQYIIIFLAVVVASLIVLTLVMPQITYHQSLPEFSLAYDLKKALDENGEFHANIDLYVYSKAGVLKINDIDVKVAITYIIFKVKNAPIVDVNEQLFNIWSNQTYAGVKSFIELKDNGYILTIFFINSTNSKTNKISIAHSSNLIKKIAIQNGIIRFLDKSYHIDGYRIIEIREIRLKL